MTALAVENVFKNFGGVAALSGVSLDVAEGERRVLLGPNGAGKTTLVRSVAGRVVPDGGSLTVLGLAPDEDAARAIRGWVPQEIALYPLLTAAENLWTFGRYQGLSGAAAGGACIGLIAAFTKVSKGSGNGPLQLFAAKGQPTASDDGV